MKVSRTALEVVVVLTDSLHGDGTVSTTVSFGMQLVVMSILSSERLREECTVPPLRVSHSLAVWNGVESEDIFRRFSFGVDSIF